MRQNKNGKGGAPGTPVGWALLVLLCAVALLLGRCVAEQTQRTAAKWETTIPNDYFAVRATANAEAEAEESGEGEAEEVMMLKIACLTFDDGPSSNTQAILDILKEADVPATFFVTAQEANLPYYPLLKTAVAEGHQIAMHSASHKYSQIYADPSAFWLDIKALRTALEPYLPVAGIHWLRFPGGSTNTVSHRYGGRNIMKTLIAQTEEKGYEWIDWNVCGEDATASHPDADRILKNIQRDSNGRDVCVVLLHDTKATGQTVKALPAIIAWYKENGYNFCTVEQMYEARDGG
ncbi:MAG: polysaccharide deacetylase [Gemmiger sp.]|nr:polysaccharide deacetylase [Gemmiger sp.]